MAEFGFNGEREMLRYAAREFAQKELVPGVEE